MAKKRRQQAQRIFPGGEGEWVRKQTFKERSLLSACRYTFWRASGKATDPLLSPPPISPLRKSILLLVGQSQGYGLGFCFLEGDLSRKGIN